MTDPMVGKGSADAQPTAPDDIGMRGGVQSAVEAAVSPVSAIVWRHGALELLDQRVLPHASTRLRYSECGEVADAIREMVVRGAPAIGVAAAYAVVLAARRRFADDPATWRDHIDADLDRLAASRPTAVNLAWALDRMQETMDAVAAGADPEPALLEAARAMHAEDIAANRRMGELGAALIESRCEVLTHCNAGALATAGYGTALGVVRAAHAAGRIAHVYAGETRPWLQGARLTAYEMVEAGIPVTLIADSAASWAMRQGRVRWVIVGADRVAANGDVANKIGTYSLAVSARHHGVRFMVVAPTSTIDRHAASGDDIPIESRRSDELLSHAGRRVAPDGAGAWNPVFDVTPAALVDALVTEHGVVEAPDRDRIAALLARAKS
ncbi:MAG: S-methyl-5-thioribose-1-phosphate isomerase [Thiotrichales bacterium]|nr:S-methyl-5-thioribose-1-phosphate isomerase [Thiotrichales bacterium]MCY4286062.1 S-methyl-5-thioribose-1-phosphate isomerase [Thiotrichales bacterium]MCY4350565.1 S-methyl-5-thioribose-1-phosphate isomerase [Thiotrichales bacterium]